MEKGIGKEKCGEKKRALWYSLKQDMESRKWVSYHWFLTILSLSFLEDLFLTISVVEYRQNLSRCTCLTAIDLKLLQTFV